MNTPHILLVDDNVIASAALKEHLESLEYTVTLADDCKQAAKVLESPEKIDLMILDYLMPEANGTDLLQSMSKRTDLQRPPVIMASSIIDPRNTGWQELFKRLTPGAQSLIYAFVTKPFSFDSLDLLLNNTLKVKAVKSDPPQALMGDYEPHPHRRNTDDIA